MWKSRDKAASFRAAFQAACQLACSCKMQAENRACNLRADHHIAQSNGTGKAFSGYYFPGPIECADRPGC